MQREELPVMRTGLERIAVKARCEPKLRFTSLAHHIAKERIWMNLSQIPAKSAAGVDGQTVTEGKESFEEWVAVMLQSVHRQGYRAPEIRRVYIPKPGKQEMRPLGVPTVADRALQRSASQVLSAIYEQDFLSCSFGGRPGRGAHQALATLHERICGRKDRVGVGGGPQEFLWKLIVPGIRGSSHYGLTDAGSPATGATRGCGRSRIAGYRINQRSDSPNRASIE
jgi:RNA-directed DNA polymerase